MAFCDCLPWGPIGDQVLQDFGRYTEWLRAHGNRIPNERLPHESLFRHSVSHWLIRQEDKLEFINLESGYQSVDHGKEKNPRCDLHFCLSQIEHWMEFKGGPGPGNSSYKTNVKEWKGRWDGDVLKLKHSKIPPSAKRHVLSFGLGLSKAPDDPPHPFYRTPHALEKSGLLVEFRCLGEVDWRMGHHAGGCDWGMNQLFMSVIHVDP